ncbi:MAG: ABC transporter ATP-binding protein [Candidatus Weimeria sp.]
MPGPRPNRSVKLDKQQKAKAKLSLKRLFKDIFSRYPLQIISVVILIFISVLCNVQGTMFMQRLIDDYITPMLKDVAAGRTADFSPLLGAIRQVMAFYILGIVATYVYNLIMIYVAQGMMKSIRDRMFVHMQDLPIRYFDNHAHGDIMSLYTNDIDTLRQMISQSVPQIINSAITVVSVLVSMFILSVPLTIVTLLMVGVMIFATSKLAGLSGKYFVEQQTDIAEVNGNVEEMMQGQKVVKVFNHEEEAIEDFERLNDKLCESAARANTYANVLGPVNSQLGNASYVLVTVIGGIMALSGVTGLTLGKLASFMSFNKSFSMPINQVSQQLNFIIMAMAGAGRIYSLLDEEPETDDGYVTLVNANIADDGTVTEADHKTDVWAWKHYHKADNTTTYQKLTGDIVLDDVNFGYVPNKEVLHHVSLYADAGQKIAFVGATGAGKTTITNLLNRFYDVEDGRIRYDGININKIKKADLRRSLGIVLQDTHLFTGTIAENIRYGRLDATDDEVKAAARLANADGFIRRLPHGYDTVIKGDGANLSMGQRQLLAIARAAIADPPVLILDEATSSIDTRTEKIVQDGMDKLMAGRTTFVIAHRLSTIRNSDCIMVLDQGRIIERGSHDELMQQGGKYYQLYTGKIVNA